MYAKHPIGFWWAHIYIVQHYTIQSMVLIILIHHWPLSLFAVHTAFCVVCSVRSMQLFKTANVLQVVSRKLVFWSSSLMTCTCVAFSTAVADQPLSLQPAKGGEGRTKVSTCEAGAVSPHKLCRTGPGGRTVTAKVTAPPAQLHFLNTFSHFINIVFVLWFCAITPHQHQLLLLVQAWEPEDNVPWQSLPVPQWDKKKVLIFDPQNEE